MKTKDIVTATAALSDAKLTGMADTDKFTVIRALRVLKPIRQQYEDFVRDASERLKPEGFDRLQERARKWNDQHKGKKMADLTDDERTELEDINTQYADYNKKVEQCVREEADRDQPLDFAKLTEEAFGKLLAANADWTAATILLLTETLMKEEG